MAFAEELEQFEDPDYVFNRFQRLLKGIVIRVVPIFALLFVLRHFAVLSSEIWLLFVFLTHFLFESLLLVVVFIFGIFFIHFLVKEDELLFYYLMKIQQEQILVIILEIIIELLLGLFMPTQNQSNAQVNGLYLEFVTLFRTDDRAKHLNQIQIA